MQRSTAVNAQDLCGFLELLLIGLVIIHIFIVVVIFILVAAAGRSVSLPLLGLAAASSSAGASRISSAVLACEVFDEMLKADTPTNGATPLGNAVDRNEKANKHVRFADPNGPFGSACWSCPEARFGRWEKGVRASGQHMT